MYVVESPVAKPIIMRDRITLIARHIYLDLIRSSDKIYVTVSKQKCTKSLAGKGKDMSKFVPTRLAKSEVVGLLSTRALCPPGCPSYYDQLGSDIYFQT